MKPASWRTAYPSSATIFDDGHGVKIVLPIVPPSANELNRRYGNRIRAAVRKAIHDWLQACLLAMGIDADVAGKRGELTKGRRRVQIVCYRGRELDADNTSAGCKPIVDELVAAGLLRDDGPKYCDLRPIVQVVVKASDQWRTECYIEAMS